jgi:hypothetical protein
MFNIGFEDASITDYSITGRVEGECLVVKKKVRSVRSSVAASTVNRPVYYIDLSYPHSQHRNQVAFLLC